MEIKNHEILFTQTKKGIYGLFGAPGSGKTEVLVGASATVLQAGYPVIYIDCTGHLNSNRFLAYEYLAEHKDLLDDVLIFQPKTNQELIEQVDDIIIHRMAHHRLLVVDDIFNFLVGHIDDITSLDWPINILNLLNEISSYSDFPVLYSTQLRRYNNERKPFLLSTSKHYVTYYFEIVKHSRDLTITLQKRNF